VQLWSRLVVEKVMVEGGRGELVWPKGKRGELVGGPAQINRVLRLERRRAEESREGRGVERGLRKRNNR